MKHIDLFNGDADGIFSLIQLRKAKPVADALLISGVKRDNALVKKINQEHAAKAENASVSVLDLSFDKNADSLQALLPVVDSVFFCDHHRASKLFQHPKLTTHINTEPTACTGLILSDLLDNHFHVWAVAAAFGDGLDTVATREAKKLGLDAEQTRLLKNLGMFVNYNGYGASVDDLNYHPVELYQILSQYESPFDVINDTDSPYGNLEDGFHIDMGRAEQCDVIEENDVVIAVQLDDAAWARRVSGVYSNKLASDNPEKAVIVATRNKDSSLTISLRAPRNHQHGAGDLCSSYPEGGGRAGAGGINKLEPHHLPIFIAMVADFYQN